MREEPQVHGIEFTGHLLQRGFWMYIWAIEHQGACCVYVGRTGDSSSPNAASPFARMSAHFDLRATARGNALVRNLRKQGIDPLECSYKLHAIGPLFAEESDMLAHSPVRDRVGTIECLIAKELRARGYAVLGFHSMCGPVDHDLLALVLDIVDQRFPPLTLDPRTRDGEE